VWKCGVRERFTFSQTVFIIDRQHAIRECETARLNPPMNISRIVTIGMLMIGASLAGCANPEQQRTATGAVLGGATGALLGQAIGGNTGSTLIGAGAGALLGAAVADSTNPRPNGPTMCRYRAPDGRIYVAECDERYYRGGY
jgi:outer membrane lipoprotein SlyB